MARRVKTDCGLSDWFAAGWIAERFVREVPEHSAAKQAGDLRTVILVCHVNSCELRLIDLLNADHGNFVHDVAGIWCHLNRRTGGLEGGFAPRFAARSEAV